MPETGGLNRKQKIVAELSYVPVFNFAMLQNNLPVVHSCKLVNTSGSDLMHLECVISAAPAFIAEKKFSLEKLRAGEEMVLDRLNLELNYEILSNLSESVKGKLKVSVASGEEEFFYQEFECEAFAPDQWLGVQVMPELLSSFVTPNLEAVVHLQSAVAQELERATGSSAVQGYQEDKERVYEICAAIYRAIHAWGIQYANPASSFGTPGQRIRFADAMYQHKLGTCLDTALLFASVMEACGLHPVLLLQSGHAYVGCHLVERYFPDLPLDDLQAIRKLADLDEFLVLETTMVTGDSTFAEAEAAARTQHLNIDGDFQFAIDVLRARHSGVRPLPLKRSVGGIEFAPVERDVEAQEAEPARKLEQEIDLSTLSREGVQPPRVVRWTQKLLDLSLRNRLLNVRDTKLVIPIACPDITLLEDKVADDESLSLNSLPNLLGEKDLYDMSMLRNCDIKSEIKELLEQELAQRRLWTILTPGEMNKRLTALYRQGKTDLEEGGVNTVFLGIGFLEWKVAERDEKSYLAPILLLPVHLQRKSIVEGIKISRMDGETVINETLLEMLRTQYHLTIPGLTPLPADAAGADVRRIMQIFRQAIKDMKGWEVREEARIGHFSFGKFVMWTDMTARLEVLKKNPLINHLITGGGLFDDDIEVFPLEEINSHLDLGKLFCPVSADSSQLAAVLYSEAGKSFVLHGPPGTGKSQTITNIIAHNLALGKRVLFVSEKKAALDVVHKRLANIGLKPFCLELHSNKSGKTEVLAQFNEALQAADAGDVPEWQKSVSALEALWQELDRYVQELHHIYPNEVSAYDCFAHLLSVKSPDDAAGMIPEIDFLTQSREARNSARQKFADLLECRKSVTPESVAALRDLDLLQWSPVREREVLASCSGLLEAIEVLLRVFAPAASYAALQDLRMTAGMYQTAQLLEMVKDCDDLPGAFFSDAFPEHAAFITGFAENAAALAALRGKLTSYRVEQFMELDFAGIRERLAKNDDAFFLVKFWKNRALLRELALLKKSGGQRLSIPELKALLPEAEEFAARQKRYDDGRPKAATLLGTQWNDGEVQWSDLKQKLEQTRLILDLLQKITCDDISSRQAALGKLQTVMPEITKLCGQGSAMRQAISKLIEAWNAFQDAWNDFSRYAGCLAEEKNIEVLQARVRQISSHIAELRNVMRYRYLSKAVRDAGWGVLVEHLETQSDERDQMALYDQLFYRTMLNQILDHSPVLCQFSGSVQNERVKQFCAWDEQYMALTQKLIFAKLAARLPRRRSGPCPEGTELGMLKRECEKRARQKPVRALLEQIPSLVALLKPCFLMSPLSVAQYLPADSEPFDLIVFDEASQIPVWDAIGVIARGKQLIVVGDPQQMPPTNFFQKGESEDEEIPEEEAEDLESILDECIAAGVHSTYLNWHYRSRHESLIEFSNHHYYDDRLFTFPAARNTEKLGVRFEFVPDGVYDRRASRTNRKEAEALVRYIFDRLERSGGQYRSIGVVTFSQAQKDLIEDLVEKERVNHPALEAYFSEAQEEPLFVKNLENVQGDERDVILFSIGYAPDASGKFSMNFGPLNRVRGERRLNVAITRAKEQVVVFSSIHGNQIDLARTQAVGAAHLKYFLEYAEKQGRIYHCSRAEGVSDGICDTVAEFLTGKGYQVERNAGRAGCRIDLAVRNPARPEEFLLGIECDNADYAKQRTTRDRDCLRRQVLGGLGWHTYRIWCIDWAFDRRRAEMELLDFIARLKDAAPARPASAPAPLAEMAAVQSEPPPEDPAAAVSKNRQEYQCWNEDSPLDQEMFYEAASRRKIKAQIAAIIQQEAPVYERLLKRRLTRAWGFTRAGGNIQKVLQECMPPKCEVTQYGDDRVFWAADRPAAEYRIYRVGDSGENKRTIDEIPPEELANAMYEVLVDFASCEKDTLFRETVRIFGLSVLTNKARKYLEYGLAVLEKSGRI